MQRYAWCYGKYISASLLDAISLGFFSLGVRCSVYMRHPIVFFPVLPRVCSAPCTLSTRIKLAV